MSFSGVNTTAINAISQMIQYRGDAMINVDALRKTIEDFSKKIGVFISVRLGSSRLPAKILSLIGTINLLRFLIDRLTLIDGIADKKQIVICTTLKTRRGLVKRGEKLWISHFRARTRSY